MGGVFFSAQAAGKPQGTQFATPTPQPDGRIIYIVQDGDNCIRISLLTGVPREQIISLNRLDENCLLVAGQELLLGIGGPSGATPTPAGAEALPPTAEAPTPTPIPGEGSICITLYLDADGNALRQDAETLIPAGAISISGASGQYSQTAETSGGPDPLCFEKIPEGGYNISIAAPEGYNPTTRLNYTLDLKSGDQIFVDFGAQPALSAPQDQPAEAESGSSNLLGVVGGGLLLAGMGLAAYAWFAYGRKPAY